MSYQVEDWSWIRKEMSLHFERHNRESGLSPDSYDFDFQTYDNLNKRGLVFAYTLRDNDDNLVGYYLAILGRDLNHKSVIQSTAMLVYVAPEFRKGVSGIRLIRGAEEELRKAGVHKIVIGHTHRKDISSLLKRLGYTPTEIVYSKDL
jgi:GNAT superfamily N-acetyltransferase